MTKWIPGLVAGLMLTSALGGCAKPAAEAEKPVCDRDCLIKLTDQYVASFVKHTAEGVPLSNEVKIVENVKPIRAGEGLWKDVTAGPTAFQVHVPDPVNETAGWLGMVQRDGKPTMVAIRLKLDPKGNTLWVQTWGDHDHDQGRGVALDAKGNAIVVGLYRFSLALLDPPLESRRDDHSQASAR